MAKELESDGYDRPADAARAEALTPSAVQGEWDGYVNR
jgi:hypothetical protein